MNLDKLRKKPGMSNAGKYNKDLVFAGPHGTYPLGYKPGQISLKRAKAANAFAHHAGAQANSIKRKIGNTLIKQGNSNMKKFGAQILDKILKKKKKKPTYGGNKGDERRSAKRDYANFKDTDAGYKSKAYGGAHGNIRRSAKKDY
jgi:hypothetical protein